MGGPLALIRALHWHPRPHDHPGHGYLARYASTVSSADEGAILKAARNTLGGAVMVYPEIAPPTVRRKEYTKTEGASSVRRHNWPAKCFQ
jgi:hypothetical protein